ALRRPAAPPAFARVLRVEGAVGDGTRALAPDAALSAGSRIVVAGAGRAELAIGRASRLRITGPARVVLGGSARDVALVLDEGTLDAEVAHRQDGERFAVATADLRV